MTRRAVTMTLGNMAFALLLISCGISKHYGEKIPDGIPAIKLKEIASNPKTFKDKEVLLAGNYGMYCCPSDFSYKEGMEGVEISPRGFASPKAQRGKPVKIYGIVRLGKHIEEESAREDGQEEKEEESHGAGFYIEARGVEFL